MKKFSALILALLFFVSACAPAASTPSGSPAPAETLAESPAAPTAVVRTRRAPSATRQRATPPADLADTFGPDRRVTLCRELTKLYEEIRRTTLGEAAAYYRETAPKGEFVLVVAGAEIEQQAVSLEDAVAQVLALKAQGVRLKDAAKEVAQHTGLSKNELYAAALEA